MQNGAAPKQTPHHQKQIISKFDHFGSILKISCQSDIDIEDQYCDNDIFFDIALAQNTNVPFSGTVMDNFR